MGHEVRPEETVDALQFLGTILPYDASLARQPKSPSEMSVKELKAAIVRNGLGSKALGFTEKQEFVALLTAFYESKK